MKHSLNQISAHDLSLRVRERVESTDSGCSPRGGCGLDVRMRAGARPAKRGYPCGTSDCGHATELPTLETGRTG